jgi:hypothetical protein
MHEAGRKAEGSPTTEAIAIVFAKRAKFVVCTTIAPFCSLGQNTRLVVLVVIRL